jgi:hypothetical protein
MVGEEGEMVEEWAWIGGIGYWGDGADMFLDWSENVVKREVYDDVCMEDEKTSCLDGECLSCRSARRSGLLMGSVSESLQH